MAMKVADFLRMINKAVNSKTLYVMGGWGYPLNAENKKRAINNDSTGYNKKPERKVKINAASSDTFAFDCCGLAKAVLWGWNADATKKNGGAVYGANGVPDWDAKELMFKGCTEQSRDWGKIEAGEFLWLDGHCGVYLGDGLAAESTPKWKDGVQITAVANIGARAGDESRYWTYHGRLKFVEYSETPEKYPACPFEADNVLKGVSIRRDHYSDSDIVGTIKQGARVEIEAIEGDFGKVSGWVYLPGGFTWTDDMDGYKVGETYHVLCGELNIRTAATTDRSEVVTTIKRGQAVTCKALTRDGYGNTWMRIESPQAGWIACLYEGNKYVG